MIGRSLLVHSATYTPQGAPDADGNVTPGTAVTLEQVRVQMAKQNAMTALGDAKDDELYLYFDCKLSKPIGQTFEVNGVVTFSSVDYRIRRVEPHYATSGTVELYKAVLVGNQG